MATISPPPPRTTSAPAVESYDPPTYEAPRKRSAWRWIVAILVLIAVAAGGWYWWSNRTAATPGPGAQAPSGGPGPGAGAKGFDPNRALPVIVEPVRKGNIDVYLNALGTVTPATSSR